MARYKTAFYQPSNANGESYEGSWVDNKREGQGVYYYEDGTKYVGRYKCDKKNG